MTDFESPWTRRLRGNVARAGIAHIVVAWLFLQVADVVLPYVGVIDQPVRWALVVSVATFPVTLFIAWLADAGWRVLELLVIVIVAAAAGWWVSGNLPEGARERTNLVILPFEYGDDAAGEGISRALAREVGSLLMKSRSVDVISDESARSPLLQGLGTVAVAERLSVGAILSGSVAASEDDMRIELRLLDAAGEALWESVIEESVANLFAVQERVATEIERRLGAGQDKVPIAQLAAERCWMPNDADALRRYFTARHYIQARTGTDESRRQIAEAIAIYQDLLEEYPEFAEARAGLAWAYEYQHTYDPENAIDRFREVASATAAEALEDCPTLGEALHLVPSRYDDDNPWIGDWRQLSAIVEMEPHKPENYQRLVRHYREAGQRHRALGVAEELLKLNPLSVRSLKELASIYMDYERFDESKDLYEQSIELGNTGPNWAIATEKMTSCREHNDAECILENLHRVHAPYKDQLRLVYREPATEAEATESIDEAMRLFDANPMIFTNWLNASACEWDHLTPLFFDIWEGSMERGSYWFWPNVWLDDCVDVWSDPRFPGFVEEAGLVEYWREVGWPEACQPQGDGFACGRNIEAD
jgi:TolB-like protein